MRLAAFACVRDERDIIEPFVRHILAFASHLTILDHGSSDGTTGVLASLRNEGLPLTILRDDSLGIDQAGRMTRMLQSAAAESPADWFLPLDADEFLLARSSVSEALHSADPTRPLALRWRGYVPHRSDDPAESNPVLRIRHRRELPAWEDSKVLIPRALAVQRGVRLRQGSHGVLLDDAEVAPIEQPHLTLAHFPVRSPEQYLAKMTIRALQYRLTPHRDPASGWAFDSALEAALRDPEVLAGNFAVSATRYGLPESFCDPIPTVTNPIDYRGGPLRFAAPQLSWYAFRNVLAFAAQVSGAPREATFQSEMSASAVQRERLLRDQFVAIRQLEQRVRTVESERDAANEQALAFAELPAALRRSWTWRLGRCIVGPVARLGRAARRLLAPRPMPATPQAIILAARVCFGAAGKKFSDRHSADRDVLDVTRCSAFDLVEHAA